MSWEDDDFEIAPVTVPVKVIIILNEFWNQTNIDIYYDN